MLLKGTVLSPWACSGAVPGPKVFGVICTCTNTSEVVLLRFLLLPLTISPGSVSTIPRTQLALASSEGIFSSSEQAAWAIFSILCRSLCWWGGNVCWGPMLISNNPRACPDRSRRGTAMCCSPQTELQTTSEQSVHLNR